MDKTNIFSVFDGKKGAFYKSFLSIILGSVLLASHSMLVFADDQSIVSQQTTDTSEQNITNQPDNQQQQTQVASPSSDSEAVDPVLESLQSNPSISSDATSNASSKIGAQPMALGEAPNQPTDGPQLLVNGKIPNAPQVNNNTGALEYSYPITLAPGRNNLTPELSINYNSQDTRSDSIIGYGWSLSIPYIQVESKHGTDQLYNSEYNDYTTSDRGELAQITWDSYQARVEDGSFSRYTHDLAGNTWTETRKNGYVYTYGSSAASRQDDAADTTHVYKWMLDSITDTNGNSISYTYYKDGGQIYPNTITYTNTAGGTGIFAVTFGRSSVPTVAAAQYATGFSVKNNYEINSITETISGTSRHSYALAYGNSDSTTRQRLSTITETGYDTSGNSITLPAEKFGYTNSNGKSFTKNNSWAMPTHSVEGNRQDSRIGDNGDAASVWWGMKTGTLIDVNGDGYPDWIESENYAYQNGSSTNGKFYDVYLGSSSGWTLSTAWSNAMPVDSTGKQYQLSDLQNNKIIDVNGDGYPDWVISTPGSTINSDTSSVWLNNHNGWTRASSWSMPTMNVSGTTYGVSVGTYQNTVTNVYGPTNYTYNSLLIDVNNDGLPDIVQTSADNFGGSATSDHHHVYLNTGSGWTLADSWTMPFHQTATGTYYGSSVYSNTGTNIITDINGDGLPDWVETNHDDSSIENYAVWINTGTGWVRSTTWTLPIHTAARPANTDVSSHIPLGAMNIICNVGLGGSYYCAQRVDSMADINNDGLPDFIETYKNTAGGTSFSDYRDVWLNNGQNGWVQNTSWAMPTPRLGNDGNFSAQLSDVNNDGLLDYVISSNSANYPNTPTAVINSGSGWDGSGWTLPSYSSWIIDNGSVLGFTDYSHGSGGSYTEHRTTVLQDVNNDGSPDWVESNQFDSPQSVTPNPAGDEKYGMWANTATQSDLLNSITYPHGGSISATYAPQTIVDKNATIQAQNIEAVTSLTSNDGIGSPTSTTSYSYTKGKYFYATDGTRRKFAGFQMVTVTNPDSSKNIYYYHQGDSVDASTYEYSDNEHLIGKLYRVDITDAAGNLYKRTVTSWGRYSVSALDNNVAFIYPEHTITEDFDGNGSERTTAIEWSYNTSNGNLIECKNYGEVTLTSPYTYSDIGSDTNVINYAYATNGSKYLLYDETVYQNSVKTAETQHFYDNLPSTQLTLGNETKTSQWKSGSTYISTLKSYNSNGTVATTTDGRGHVTTNTAYDGNNLYPITVTDSLGHVVHYTYDYMLGKIIQTTDPNSQVYVTNYDAMGRVASQQIPDPSSGSTVNRISYSYDTPSNGNTWYTAETIYTDGGTVSTIYNYRDGFGRDIEDKKQTDPNGVWSNYQTINYAYDGMGRLAKQSIPYNSYGPIFYPGDVPTSDAMYTVYAYDPEGRVLTTTNNIGSTTNAYDQWKTTTTDPNGNVKGYYLDAYGNLSQVDENDGGSTYSTYYTYDPSKNITKITDAAGNVRNFTYDGLGNRLTAQDLHASADTTYGTWTYSYDDNNNLSRSVSPNGATVNYTYNNDDQKLTEDYTGSAGTEITYTYDTCTQGIGHLCSVSMSSGANTSYTYDYDGNIASENRTINSTPFLTSYTYNRHGDIATITYPDISVVQYNYLSDGLVGSIQRKESGGSFVPVVSSIGYSPDFQISSLGYANGVTTTNTYDAAKEYRLTNKLSQNGSGTALQNISYGYDVDNNIISTTDSSLTDAAKTVAYSYDSLNRLKTATATGVASGTPAYSQTFNYDSLGNITSGPSGTYLYQGNIGTSRANPDAATSINGIPYTYDNDGNLKGNRTLANTWNYKDQLTTTINGMIAINYFYDQSGNRVWYKVGSASTYYPNKYYSDDGSTKTKQIYLGNILVATVLTQGGVTTPFYVHTDNVLGSNIITDASGAQTQLLDYLPFGDIRLNEKSGTFDEKDKFGGHQYDADTDLNYMVARYYAAKVGRFISEDPSSQSNPEQFLMDPQQLNFYSYARNNPLTNIDPDGNSVVGTIWNNITTGPVQRYQSVQQSISQGSWQPLQQSFVNQFQQLLPQPTDSRQVAFNKNINLVLSATGAGEANLENQEIKTAFTQTTISSTFSKIGTFAGRALDDVVSDLKTGILTSKDLPINYTEVNGVRLVDNNRSAYVLKQAGIPESNWNWIKGNQDVIDRVQQKLTNNNLTNQGTNSVRITSGK